MKFNVNDKAKATAPNGEIKPGDIVRILTAKANASVEIYTAERVSDKEWGYFTATMLEEVGDVH